MAANAAFPGLSDLLGWPTDHLTDGAEYWQAVAARWYEAFAQVWHDSLSVDWEDRAVKALHDRTYADKVEVSGLVDRLHEAATIARSGASDLDAARSGMRSAVEDACAAGFEVGEQLSITDRSVGGSAAARSARRAQAQAFAGDIRWRAAHLVEIDRQVAGRITAALVDIGKMNFAEAAMPGIQLVDNHWHQDSPSTDGSPPPEGPHFIYCYPSARPDHWWCEGYEEGKGPYAFFSPFDTSGVA
ncbi:MAG: hypothetical protein JO082_15090 [Mycobacterium sp.]|nr:hypothetical protein [Mycobacterium sp.]